jgi:hypothetical protein
MLPEWMVGTLFWDLCCNSHCGSAHIDTLHAQRYRTAITLSAHLCAIPPLSSRILLGRVVGVGSGDYPPHPEEDDEGTYKCTLDTAQFRVQMLPEDLWGYVASSYILGWLNCFQSHSLPSTTFGFVLKVP